MGNQCHCWIKILTLYTLLEKQTKTTSTGSQSLPLTTPPKMEEKRCFSVSQITQSCVIIFFVLGDRCSQGEHHEARRRIVPAVLQGRGRPLPQHWVRPDDRWQHHHAARLQAPAVWRYGRLPKTTYYKIFLSQRKSKLSFGFSLRERFCDMSLFFNRCCTS